MKKIKELFGSLRNNTIAFAVFFISFPICNYFFQGNLYSMLGSFLLTLMFIYFTQTKKLSEYTKNLNPIVKAISVISFFFISSILVQIAKEKHTDDFLIIYLSGFLYQVSIFFAITYILETFYAPKKGGTS